MSCVVRLNEADTYDAQDFTANGINHAELYFDDCTVPPSDIVERFLNLCDSEPGAIAVHCKAGLGRTGTLIALWMMKHHGFTSNEAIAWLRIVRPGSVIGPQQEYLRAAEGGTFEGNKLILEGQQPEENAELSAQIAAQVARAMDVRAENRTNEGGG